MRTVLNERIMAVNLCSLLTSTTVIIKIWHVLYAMHVDVPVVSENVFLALCLRFTVACLL